MYNFPQPMGGGSSYFTVGIQNTASVIFFFFKKTEDIFLETKVLILLLINS